ncbi:unnamed protein product, partial [Ectocarpus sp. 12 AP-2014]
MAGSSGGGAPWRRAPLFPRRTAWRFALPATRSSSPVQMMCVVVVRKSASRHTTTYPHLSALPWPGRPLLLPCFEPLGLVSHDPFLAAPVAAACFSRRPCSGQVLAFLSGWILSTPV